MLSILIPTYNYNIYPLVHVLHQQAEYEDIDFEIIVCDDCSTVNFEQNITISSLTRCVYFKNAGNKGRTATRQLLAEMANFDTLLFLDADVLPVHPDFLQKYIAFIGKNTPVVIGGIAYKETNDEPDTELRHKYGRMREQKTALERSKNPYGSVLSGNLLITKKVFLGNNYSKAGSFYGMDIYFSYRLYKNDITVIHIDNPVYHLGLEDNPTFFKKSLEAVVSRKQLLASAEGIENINSLLRHYKTLKKYRLVPIVAFAFKAGAPLLKKMILKKDPSLFCLDIYRLGYICTIK